ncbi:o-succinylbenzoate synthase/o-succinylbenzoate synthase,TIGR01928 [Halobacillus karajensis]|uniref:Dipeptide epimerase n=1 Tax=Halobacillus karajensis TaxID=195088 RepID=A0A024P481_9BACI|nr:dipeptide epimerase [Halobacillus karajensis]CDQ19952.1 L-Ala-D/L-Glu epimerase [Halobacillus karajensis]CDQ22412.1 L-Ala-D/L-Glu epimerase [Halobacillus karajensis]CDQ28255.1 L-Ala-D/L-Glu epimerase [Halobacillus karajensis]SEH69285.1 o-succinylbenzoate synthase/o-succinylbenzoate synthase,TIGR01928 [Halobacillus karajensis]
MNIQSIDTYPISVPLHTPFKTALRTVTVAESIYVKVTCEDGTIGWGEAPPTVVITGESLKSIEHTIKKIIAPRIIGKPMSKRERLFEAVQQSCVGNTSAKAAVDIALYDCFAKRCQLPLYQLLGGYHDQLETDYTVSVNEPGEMAKDAEDYVEKGFHILKVKVGKDTIEKDLDRIQAIHRQVGDSITIRLDANQGWTPKEAIYAIQKMEAKNLPIELVEQPVKAHDIEGLKQVTDHTSIPIMADESVFSCIDAKRIIETRSADLINIKLMKSGGIHEALKINHLAEAYGVECMVGSMIETKLGITAAAHLAASQKNITRVDFDAPLMLTGDPVHGGVVYSQASITFSEGSGLGVHYVDLEEAALS